MDTDNRTHGSESAVDDDMTPLPRGAGADAPQSDITPGNMPLEYTEQNFNALVAANTAMETALNDSEVQAAAQAERVMELRNSVEQLRGIEDRFDRVEAASLGKLKAADKLLVEEAEAHRFTKARLRASERRLERAKGYIDRVLDDERRFAAPQTETRPIPRPPVGPDLESIPDPRRSQASDSMFFPGETLKTFGGDEQRRRY